MKHLIGTLTHAGDLDVNSDQYSGCALEIDRVTLINAKTLPMYRKCIIIPISDESDIELSVRQYFNPTLSAVE